jgi:hypothetical protein
MVRPHRAAAKGLRTPLGAVAGIAAAALVAGAAALRAPKLPAPQAAPAAPAPQAAHHAPAFPHINLRRVSARRLPFILARTPAQHLRSQGARRTRTGGQILDQPLDVFQMFLIHLRARSVRIRRIGPIHSDVICRNGAIVVHVRLAIRHGRDIEEIIDRKRVARCDTRIQQPPK